MNRINTCSARQETIGTIERVWLHFAILSRGASGMDYPPSRGTTDGQANPQEWNDWPKKIRIANPDQRVWLLPDAKSQVTVRYGKGKPMDGNI